VRRSLVLAVILAVTILNMPSASAQQATPNPGTAAPLLRLPLAELPPDRVVNAGFTRTIFEPNGSVHLLAGAGPMVLYVETGEVSVRAVDPSQPFSVIRAGSAAGSATPEPAEADHVLVAGDSLVLAAGTSADVLTQSGTPAATLTLISALDATTEASQGTTSSVLAGGRPTLPTPSVEVLFEIRTLAAGEFLPVSAAPAVSIVAAINRSQAFKLGTAATGYTNRDAVPMTVYVLTISPGPTPTGTPSA
jgi:hypothetical protein